MKPTFRSLLRNWWKVAVWLGVIRLESTDLASADNTTSLLYKVIVTVSPQVEPSFVEQLDHVLRKTGHFLGYGILAGLVFLALRNTNRDRLRAFLPRAWGSCLRDLWRREWACIAMLFTIVTAAFDEIHQSFIPSRTGRWQDVVLDACGAAVVQGVIYLLALRMLKRRHATTPEPQLTSTR